MITKTTNAINKVENIVSRIPCLEKVFAISAGTIIPIPRNKNVENGMIG